MWRAAIGVLLAACELQPAPKLVPHRDASVAIDAQVPAPVATDAAIDAAQDDDGGPEPSADCVTTAQQIASVVIAGADPGVRGHYEQGRGNMIRVMAAACTSQGWTADKQQCFRLAKLETDIRACEAKFPKLP
jgi:hypothetical protein